MRKFTIVHVSDLHLKTWPDESASVLRAALTHALANTSQPRVLVLSGDLVDSPDRTALQAAKNFVDDVSSLVDRTLVIPGNHDVKNFFGSFSKSEAFNKTFSTGNHLLLREVGLHLLPLDSTSAGFARGSVKQAEYDKLVRQYYDAEKTEPNLETEERIGLVRVVAIHHHPLPLQAGEGQKILGVVKDEGMMYLESPASFLDACLHSNVSLILHGHRHVEGLTRYSVLADTYASEPSSAIGVDSGEWKTLYVLSAPSATGRGCDAGFNVINFEISIEGAFADVVRYRRPKNRGPFVVVDAQRQDGKIRLPFSEQLIRDVAIDVEAALSRLPEIDPPEQQLFPIVAQLFHRRAFMQLPERHWGQLFYATMKTRLVWQNQVQRRLRKRRQDSAEAVLHDLFALEEFVAEKVLGLELHEPDDLRMKFMHDKKAFLAHLPVAGYEAGARFEHERGQILERLRANLKSCGIPTSGFGQAPWGPGGE